MILANRIGVLGGMGPLATCHFLDLFHNTFSETLDPICDQDFPDMTVLMENTTPDRTAAIKNGMAGTVERINKNIKQLLGAGCDPIVIPCVTAHAYVDSHYFAAGVLDFRDCIIRHFSGEDPKRLAVLATDGAMTLDVFAPLAKRFNLVYPTKAEQSRLMSIIYGPAGLKAPPTDIHTCKNELDDVITKLQDRGADFILAGCTEIEMFLATQECPGNYVLPMVALCKGVLERLRDRS